jgi:PAS domain S-box-containing protein
MKIRHNQRARLAVAAPLLLGIAGLALITFVCFRVGFGLARTGFAYVILITLVSLLGSFSTSVVLSIIAAACLNYFFAPPLFELRIDAVDDVVRIAAFLATSLVVTALTAKLKRTGQELGESKARLEEAQRIAHLGWWERDLRRNRVSLADEVCRILGVQPVDLPEWHGRWLELIHPEDRARVAEAAAAALQRGGPRYDVEYRVVRPDDTLRVIHSRGDVTWNDAGAPVRQFGVLQDITQLRETERELRASEARFRTFVDYATDGFFLLDDESTVLDVNRQACEGLGYTRQELIGKHRSDFDIGLGDASIQSLKQRIAAAKSLTFETRHRRKDGTSFPVELRVAQFEQGGRRFLCLARGTSPSVSGWTMSYA